MRLLRWGALIAVAAVLLLALTGPWWTPASTTTPVGTPFRPPDGIHLLGTDVLGRDALARLLAGGRTLVLQALAATLAGSIAGVSIGAWTAMTRWRAPAIVVLRVVDGVAALPALLLLLLLAAGAPGDDVVVALAVVLVSLPFSVRVVAERTRALTASPYHREAVARGDRAWERLRHDIAPGLLPVALAEAGVRFIAAVQIAATASFLGLGAGAPAASWGRMVRENTPGLDANPGPVVVPAVLLVVLAGGVIALLDRASLRRLDGAERIEGTP